MRQTLLLLLMLILSPGAWAADDWQARMEAATQAAEQADALEWQAREARARRAAEAARPGYFHWEALPEASAPPQDIRPMVDRFQGYLSQQRSGGQPAPGGLSVFVSLGMPEGSLKLLATEAERTGATLVLRGMIDQSLTKTLLAVRRLTGDRQIAWSIDPEAFTRFQVQSVPVFVLTRPGARTAGCGEEMCFPGEDYLRLAGDVSIQYALDTMARMAPDYAEDVARARGGRP